MQPFVTAVMISTLKELTAISSNAWPSLGIVVVKGQIMNAATRDAIAQCKLQVLAVLALHAQEEANLVVLVLKPSTDQRCQVLSIRMLLESLSSFMHVARTWKDTTPWHLGVLMRYTLRQSQLSSNSLAQLFSMHWPRLECLDLFYTALDAAAVVALAKDNWPRRSCLSLNCSTQKPTAVAQLNQGFWPRVRYFHLTGAPFAFSDATLAAFVAAWPMIDSLSLQRMKFGAEFSVALGRTHAHLSRLCLYSVSRDADKLSGFTLASWNLTRLQLRSSRLRRRNSSFGLVFPYRAACSRLVS